MKTDNLSKITHLLFALTSVLEKNASQILATKSSLTFSEYKVLSVLNAEQMNQTLIAKYLKITKAAVSKTVLNLKQKNLVTTKSRAGNREILDLTKSGSREFENAKKVLHDDSPNSISSILSLKEQDLLIEKLQKLYTALKK
jgi:DNA-binding MarR family transcriptional regulator